MNRVYSGSELFILLLILTLLSPASANSLTLSRNPINKLSGTRFNANCRSSNFGSDPSTFSVTPANYYVPASPAGSTAFLVNTSSQWSVTSDQSWCVVEVSSIEIINQ
ncbi:MAG: BACON domain-containing protein [Bacteroidetes bacterium]|nr:BACON domain-containing protein [Bacteroidota bacterium]